MSYGPARKTIACKLSPLKRQTDDVIQKLGQLCADCIKSFGQQRLGRQSGQRIGFKKINASYNFFLHYAPGKNDLHLHIEITPRTATWAGFEFSTNSTINSVMPEDAARFYKGK